jgi:hypothetical protein
MSDAAPRFKAALYTVCQSLFPDPVQVAYGHPGLDQQDDIVSIGRTTSTQEQLTFGTTRSREETVTCEITFSCYRGGGPEMEQVVTERAFSLLGQLEDYLRATDITLGGVCRFALLTSTECDGVSDPDILQQGRLIEVIATITGYVRLS